MIIISYTDMLINQKRQQLDGLDGFLIIVSQSINQVIFKCQQSIQLQLTTE